MEKSLKFTANELLDSINREFNGEEMDELYKALIAYNMGLDEITPDVNEKLEKVLEFYYDADYISGIVSTDIMEYADQMFEGGE
jgi:hypothetical protein